MTDSDNKNSNKKLLIIALAVFSAGLIIFIASTATAFWVIDKAAEMQEEEKNELKNLLMENEWYFYDEDLSSILYFEFSEDLVKYSGEFFGFSKSRIANIEYTVIDGETIYVNDNIVDVEVGEDGEYVIFTPSFVDGRESILARECD